LISLVFLMAAASKILLIDNNDSFTYNIIDLLRKLQCEGFGVIRSESLTIDQLDDYTHLIISPGPGLPEDFPILKDIIAYAKDKERPLLGVCLGHQAICTYFGGEMIQLAEVIHGRQSTVKLEQHATLHEGLPEEIVVGRYHSWSIDQSTLPKQLKITGMTTDGCLMSIEHRSLPIYGVQYHPESFLTISGDVLFRNFIKL
ncbi:MAG: aminodeoxychorismate/anthranilate synthase component II, partial [Bacteroidota bacterium]